LKGHHPNTPLKQVFIIISGLGGAWAWFFLPETKGVPLEEMAALFGDTDEVMIFSEDIHLDQTTHDLVVDRQASVVIGHHGSVVIERQGSVVLDRRGSVVATEPHGPAEGMSEKAQNTIVEKV